MKFCSDFIAILINKKIVAPVNMGNYRIITNGVIVIRNEKIEVIGFRSL